jgi:hypothetical protein
MKTFSQFVESVGLPNQVFHGTTAAAGRQVEQQRILRPRGRTAGNWSGGWFGGNPSNPDYVYCGLTRDTALYYAKEICRMSNTKDGAIVIANPNWKMAVIDEDTVHELLSNSTPQSNMKIWQAAANYLQDQFGEPSTPEEAYEGFQMMADTDISDSGYAEHMKAVADRYTKLLSPIELATLLHSHNVVAFEGELPVVNVEFITV